MMQMRMQLQVFPGWSSALQLLRLVPCALGEEDKLRAGDDDNAGDDNADDDDHDDDDDDEDGDEDDDAVLEENRRRSCDYF
jgi:hypothetical protein